MYRKDYVFLADVLKETIAEAEHIARGEEWHDGAVDAMAWTLDLVMNRLISACDEEYPNFGPDMFREYILKEGE